MRDVAHAFGVSSSTVSLWVGRAQGLRLDRVDFDGDKPGLAANRLADSAERRILRVRKCVFRESVTDRFGIVTAEFGNVTGDFGNVSEGVFVTA